jgi:co-chaperonin GroES (HSP10)
LRLTVDNIAIKPLTKVERAVGKIILPQQAEAPFMMWGEVLAVGPGFRSEKSKTLWPTFVKPGDRVLYPKGAARLTYENIRLDGVFHDEVAFVAERDAGLVLRDGKIYPMYRRVVGHVVEESKAELTDSGLVLFTADKRKTEKATSFVRIKIDYVGFGQRADDARLIPTDVRVGDYIVADKYDAWEYELLDGDAMSGHVILDEDQILAIDEGFVEAATEDLAFSKIMKELRAGLR